MGNRRLGLGRLEKAFEALARDLNMSSATISGSPTCTLGATTLSSTLTYASGKKGIVPILTTATPTTIAAGALTANTVYRNATTSTAVFSLPARADSTAGDWIKVFYTDDIDDAAKHDYGTSGEVFATTSLLFKATAAPNAQVWGFAAADGTDDDYIKLTGATDGGSADGGVGIGTTLTFVFDGTAWSVDAWVYAQGEGNANVTAAFAETSG